MSVTMVCLKYSYTFYGFHFYKKSITYDFCWFVLFWFCYSVLASCWKSITYDFVSLFCLFCYSVSTSRSVPARLQHATGVTDRELPQSVPAVHSSSLATGARRLNQSQGNIADRPPPPLPNTSTIPVKIPQHSSSHTTGPYLKMNSSGLWTGLLKLWIVILLHY